MRDQKDLNREYQGNAIAVNHCAAGVASILGFRHDALQHIDAAIVEDKNFMLPRVLKGWVLHGGRDASNAGAVNKVLTGIKEGLQQKQSRESKLLEALQLSRAGRGVESATVLETMLGHAPMDLLVHQILQEEIFWMGEPQWMRSVTEKAASSWQETSDGYSTFLSLRAFANEEAGYLDDAERYGRMAVEMNPADIWGAHAVAHVLIMKGEIETGVAWLENLSSHWQPANQMKHHLWWHLCLFLFELGDYERILSLLTTEIRKPDSALIQASPAAPIDIQNFSSLLLRLELYGVNVGNYWDTLASICADRVHNHGNAFGNIHDMMVLAASGQYDKGQELLESMRDCYAGKSGSVALGYNAAGIPACEAVLAHFRNDFDAVLNLLGSVRHNLRLIGASHAQRDVFYHMLVYAAKQTGRDDLCRVFLDDIERIGFCQVPERAAYKGRAH